MELTDDERALLVAAKNAGMTHVWRSDSHGQYRQFNFGASHLHMSELIDDLLEPPMQFDKESERLMRAAASGWLALIRPSREENHWYVMALVLYAHWLEDHMQKHDKIIPIPARYRSEP